MRMSIRRSDGYRQYELVLPFGSRRAGLALADGYDNDQLARHEAQKRSPNGKKTVTDLELESRCPTAGEQYRADGYLTPESLSTLERWKSPTFGTKSSRNATEWIQQVSAAALKCDDDRLKAGMLTLLIGVRLPMASAILHHTFPDRMAIWDWRVLHALGVPCPAYYEDPIPESLHAWDALSQFLRVESARLRVSVRQLDKALWWYSKSKLRHSKSQYQRGKVEILARAIAPK